MFKALLRKQMMEIKRMYFRSRRKNSDGTERSRGSGFIVFFIIIYIFCVGGFFALSALIGGSLMEPGLTWIYFMIMNGIAFLAGVFGSVFTTAFTLFQAKDNEFLLALPIPPSQILITRMVSVYIMGVIYESMVMLPAVAFYFIFGNPSFISVILSILGIFVLGFIVLVFSCLFGWVVSLITSRLKNKSFLTVLISVVFIGLFIWFRVSANSLFRDLASHSQDIGNSVKGWGYPLYALGLGMSGDILSFLAFVGMTAVLFALTCLILSKSFKRIVSVKNEGSKASFSESQIRTRKVSSALRRKEFKRFTSSPNYMLNCGLGILFMLAGAVFLLIKMGDVRQFMDTNMTATNPLFIMMPVAGTFAVCLLTSLIDIAAPSISLEGKNVWILQSLPVDACSVFNAKLFVHISVALVPSIISTVIIIIVLRINILTAIAMLLCVSAYIFFSANTMLALDLKRPMLDWTNETQPIKQSLNILFSWLGSMLLSAAFAALYLLLATFVHPAVYLLICTVILALLTFLIQKWFRGKGRKLFAAL